MPTSEPYAQIVVDLLNTILSNKDGYWTLPELLKVKALPSSSPYLPQPETNRGILQLRPEGRGEGALLRPPPVGRPHLGDPSPSEAHQGQALWPHQPTPSVRISPIPFTFKLLIHTQERDRRFLCRNPQGRHQDHLLPCEAASSPLHVPGQAYLPPGYPPLRFVTFLTLASPTSSDQHRPVRSSLQARQRAVRRGLCFQCERSRHSLLLGSVSHLRKPHGRRPPS